MPRLLAELAQDSRYAVRSLLRQPVYALTVVLTFGVGLGANVAVFSLLDATLLRPLPFTRPDELMAVSLRMPVERGFTDMTWSFPKYEMFAREQQSFAATAVWSPAGLTLSRPDGAERLDGETVSSSYFSVLGLRPQMGSLLSPDQDVVGSSPRQIVLSHQFWQAWLGGAKDVLGRTLVVNGAPLQVVGVMPPGFRGLSAQAEFWVPLSVNRRPSDLRAPHSHNLRLLARRKANVTPERVAAELNPLGARIDATYPDGRRGHWSAVAHDLGRLRADGTLRWSMIALAVAVMLVLLIASVNIASLTLARAAARRRELSVRVAIGADPGRLTRQLLTETLVLSAAGLVVALVIGAVVVRGLAIAAPLNAASFTGSDTDLSRLGLSSIALDGRVILITLVVALASACLVGIAPALLAARAPAMDAMRVGASSPAVFSGMRRLTGRGMLVIAEIALAVLLLVASSLTIRSLRALLDTPLGYDVDRVLSMRVRLPDAASSADSTNMLWTAIVDRVAALPGVTSVGVGICSPIGDPCDGTAVAINGDRFEQHIGYHVASPDYFRTLGMRVVRGRVFDATDTRDAPSVIVNEAAARQLWHGRDPLRYPLQGDSGRTIPVVGIVADARYEDVQAAPRPEMYVSLARAWRRGGVVFVRTGADPDAMLDVVRREIRSISPSYAVSGARTFRQALHDVTARSRFTTQLLTGFATLALLLAALGIYGVLAIAVAQRTREMGIRVALGAARWRVTRMVVGQAVALASVGAGIGLVGAVIAARALRVLLYGVTPLDTASYVVSTGLLLMVATAAAFIPAVRAGRVSPTEALRSE